MATDIVVTTCERLGLLVRTLAHIWARTTTPYRLHIIDDASTEGNAEYVAALHAEGKLAGALLREQREGIPANLCDMLSLTESDPLVFTDDDVLCPLLEPDWLARGLAQMDARQKLGILALHNPARHVRRTRRWGERTDGPVTYCRNVGGTFTFVRREVLRTCAPPRKRDQAAMHGPVHALCKNAAACGWRVGYLTDAYCQHIGPVSVRSSKRLHRKLAAVAPVDEETLMPPKPYRK